nr:1,2-phenylacetyl-CoA epoxidase subunit PaaC [Nocardioides ungokensis]
MPPEDALAFFREAGDFRNVRLTEVDNGDFAHTIARLLVLSCARLALFQRLATSRDTVLAAVAAKGVKELAYHRDYAGRWFLTLAQGTDESRRRLLSALDEIWPLYAELFATHPVEQAVAAAGVGVDPATTAAEVDVVLEQVFAMSGVDRPDRAPLAGVQGRTGRDGLHTRGAEPDARRDAGGGPGAPEGAVVSTPPLLDAGVLDREALRERAYAVARTVTDPEMPMLTLEDLGVLREVDVAGEGRSSSRSPRPTPAARRWPPCATTWCTGSPTPASTRSGSRSSCRRRGPATGSPSAAGRRWPRPGSRPRGPPRGTTARSPSTCCPPAARSPARGAGRPQSS